MSEIFMLSEPEFMGEFPVRKDLVITKRSAQYGNNGECLHINKSWYTLAEAAYYGFYLLRSCADCKLLLTRNGKEILSRQHFLEMLAATDCTEEQADILLKAFEKINGVGDKMEKTLWQHWTQKSKVEKVENVLHNELGYKVGQFVTIDILDYRDQDFKIYRIEEILRKIDQADFYSTDYILDGDMKLRAADDKCWLLKLHDEFGYDEEFVTVLDNAMSSSFNIDEIEFFPVGSPPSKIPVRIIVTNDQAEKQAITMWVFGRDALDEAGHTYVELLFIERSDDGWFSIWRGIEVAIANITVI